MTVNPSLSPNDVRWRREVRSALTLLAILAVFFCGSVFWRIKRAVELADDKLSREDAQATQFDPPDREQPEQKQRVEIARESAFPVENLSEPAEATPPSRPITYDSPANDARDSAASPHERPIVAPILLPPETPSNSSSPESIAPEKFSAAASPLPSPAEARPNREMPEVASTPLASAPSQGRSAKTSVMAVKPQIQVQPVQWQQTESPAEADKTHERYVVKKGESLFDIARFQLGQASRYIEIYELNRDLLKHDINYPPPGLRLRMPEGQRQQDGP